MRIVHIYKDYYPVMGGMENHIRMLAEYQSRMGHEVTVLVTGPTSRTEVGTMGGVRVIKAGRLAKVASTPLSISLPLLVKKERARIAHLHFPYPVGELSYLLFGRAERAILTYHSDVIRQKGILRFYKPFLRKVLRRVDHIIATSDRYVDSSPFLAEVRPKCTVIPLGIELAPFLEADEEKVRRVRRDYGSPLVLFVGKFRYYKGVQYLLEAMKQVTARLLLVGSGPMERQWRDLAQSSGLAGKVVFAGEVSDEDLPAYYHAADVFVLPACERSEAFGLVQVEAMAAGTPVVCTELGTGTSFVNAHGETGFVVPPRDPGALAAAITDLIHDKGLRDVMGRRARERALREFALDVMAGRVMKLYERIACP